MIESITNLADTSGRKFQSLADNINELIPTIQQGEAQFGILGLVAKLEGYLKSEIEKKLGLRVVFNTDKTAGYLVHLSVSGPVPVITLKRKFSLDIINAAKRGDVRPVINTLKSEITNQVKRVRAGVLEERYKREYLVFEVEGPAAPGGVGDSVGTLASFKGVLPVDKLSLVDTDGETDYVAKEYKKNHFVLHPTKEHFIYKPEKDYLQRTVINCLYNKGLSEAELRNYLHIARNGMYTIIKEHISESANYQYRRLGNSITLSTIRYSKEK